MKIYLIGFMGAGKTHWGRALSQKINMPFYDLDQLIEEKEEETIAEMFRDEGEEHFRMVEKEVLHLVSESHPSFVMACGGGTPCYFNNIEYMKKSGIVVWIHCSIDCLHERLIKERSKRPLVASLTDDELRTYIIKKMGDRRIYYQQANVVVQEEDLNLDDVTNQIFHA